MKQLLFLSAVTTLMILGCTGGQNQNNSDNGAVESAPALTLAWKTDTVFTGSESALYDAGSDVIYVSNGNTASGEKDNDGFISLINTDGTIRELKWIAGGLDAPKGMALLDGKLYVTDIDAIKVIDIVSATIEKTIPVENAVFLNDMATDGEQLYFSDSRGGTIYSMTTDGRYTSISTDSEGVNGLECLDGQLFALDSEGLKKFSTDGNYSPEIVNAEVTGGDGLIILDDSTFVASRWHGEIFMIRDGKATVMLDTQAEKSNTADIGFVSGLNLVLVPTFLKNEVAAYNLSY